MKSLKIFLVGDTGLFLCCEFVDGTESLLLLADPRSLSSEDLVCVDARGEVATLAVDVGGLTFPLLCGGEPVCVADVQLFPGGLVGVVTGEEFWGVVTCGDMGEVPCDDMIGLELGVIGVIVVTTVLEGGESTAPLDARSLLVIALIHLGLLFLLGLPSGFLGDKLGLSS